MPIYVLTETKSESWCGLASIAFATGDPIQDPNAAMVLITPEMLASRSTPSNFAATSGASAQ
ncbi:hypothetical protein GGH95_004006 [Coemansia sp. RSA 1836]|nr:hypothetical protein GGH95_004006 [Coemansia sp. RSA 1836]